MKKLLLIDAHAIIYRMYHALAPLTGPNHEPVGALYGLAKLLLKIKKEMSPQYIAACFDRPEPTFREERYSSYKATRQAAPQDLVPQLISSRDVFSAFKIKCFELPGFEADDIIGTLAKKYSQEKDLQVVILTGDRDLLQLVRDDKVVVELIKNGGEQNVLYTEEKVFEEYGISPRQIIDLKGLVGDASDNIPGVAKIGPKTATPLIKDFGSVEGVFENLVIINPKIAKKLEDHKEQAFLSKELATIKENAPIFLDALEDLRSYPPDKEELKKYFEKLGFVSLVKSL